MSNKPSEFIFCQICNTLTKYKTYDQFIQFHCSKQHNINRLHVYYDMFMKKEGEDICVICGKKTTFISSSKGYSHTCSYECKRKNFDNEYDIAKRTKKEKYGDEYFNNRKLFKKTMNDRYGTTSTLGIPSVKAIILEKGRKTRELKGQQVPLELLSEWERYKRLVDIETHKNINELFESWDGKCYYTGIKLNTTHCHNKKKYDPIYRTIDHKTSKYEGFIKGIGPEIIGGLDNLCLCCRILNSMKSNKNEPEFKIYLEQKIKTGKLKRLSKYMIDTDLK